MTRPERNPRNVWPSSDSPLTTASSGISGRRRRLRSMSRALLAAMVNNHGLNRRDGSKLPADWWTCRNTSWIRSLGRGGVPGEADQEVEELVAVSADQKGKPPGFPRDMFSQQLLVRWYAQQVFRRLWYVNESAGFAPEPASFPNRRTIRPPSPGRQGIPDFPAAPSYCGRPHNPAPPQPPCTEAFRRPISRETHFSALARLIPGAEPPTKRQHCIFMDQRRAGPPRPSPRHMASEVIGWSPGFILTQTDA